MAVQVKPAFTLPARAFTPPPKVDSTVVEFVPRPAPVAEADGDALEKVVAAAFSQRRKMLRAGLKGLFDDPAATLEAVGVAPTARAETVDIADFAHLPVLCPGNGLTATATHEDVLRNPSARPGAPVSAVPPLGWPGPERRCPRYHN